MDGHILSVERWTVSKPSGTLWYIYHMITGYMIYVQTLSRLWNSDDKYRKILLWGLKQEIDRPFLGVAAVTWNMLSSTQKHRWNHLARNDVSSDLLRELELDHEMDNHITRMLASTLIP